MIIPENKLIVKRSGIPGAGKGLFTKVFIPEGTRIIEYKGSITTWKDVNHNNGENRYIFYINRNRVIDANPHPEAIARYANDARGLKQMKGTRNNSTYLNEKNKIFIVAERDIAAGEEILVDYGKEYWDTISYNRRMEKKNAKVRSNS
jgi:uncharacterized protein